MKANFQLITLIALTTMKSKEITNFPPNIKPKED